MLDLIARLPVPQPIIDYSFVSADSLKIIVVLCKLRDLFIRRVTDYTRYHWFLYSFSGHTIKDVFKVYPPRVVGYFLVHNLKSLKMYDH